MNLPLGFRDAHQELLVFDRYPAGEDFHRVLEIRVQEDLTGAVDQGGGGCVQDVKATVIGWVDAIRGSGCTGHQSVDIWVAQEHEDVPNAKLCGERDGVVEESEVPACTVGCGGDA